MSTLTVKNISKHFDGVKAVDELSVRFESGQITGIIGPNGSGKSTLINLLTGVIPFDSGVVILSDSVKLSQIKPQDVSTYGITRTFQDVRLFEQMTVLDNVLVVLTDRGVVGSLFEKHTAFHLDQAQDVLEQVGLWVKRDELASGLSYGQRKLLEMARVLAMASNPSLESQVIFFDEPFAGLFPEMVKLVSQIIQDLRAKGKAVVLVEHNMDLIRQLCDRLIVVDSGALLAEGKPEAVLSRREVVEAYLGE